MMQFATVDKIYNLLFTMYSSVFIYTRYCIYVDILLLQFRIYYLFILLLLELKVPASIIYIVSLLKCAIFFLLFYVGLLFED